MILEYVACHSARLCSAFWQQVRRLWPVKFINATARQGWNAQMQAALATSQEPEGELLEGFSDAAFEDVEWHW